MILAQDAWFEILGAGQCDASKGLDGGRTGEDRCDKFCSEGADGTECTNYPAPATEILDLQLRTTEDLQLNHFWPQNYDADGTVVFDQTVVATRRVGCMR